MRSANFSEPLWGCRYHALIGLIQTSGLAGGFDYLVALMLTAALCAEFALEFVAQTALTL